MNDLVEQRVVVVDPTQTATPGTTTPPNQAPSSYDESASTATTIGAGTDNNSTAATPPPPIEPPQQQPPAQIMPPDLNESVGGEAANLSSNSIVDLSSINVMELGGTGQPSGVQQPENPPSPSTQPQQEQPNSPSTDKRKSMSKKRKLDELGAGLEYISDSESTSTAALHHLPQIDDPNNIDLNNHHHHHHHHHPHHHHHHLSPNAPENGFDLSAVDPTQTESAQQQPLPNGSSIDANNANSDLGLDSADRVEGTELEIN